MMDLAIVGSRELEGNNEAQRIINNILRIVEPERVISGGATGVDSMAVDAAQKHGINVVEYLPENERWEPNGYKARNKRIAEACDALIRVAATTSNTYGSGWTRDKARALGKPTLEFTVNPDE